MKVDHSEMSSPHGAGTAYVASNRYGRGDFAPYVYRTDDYGQTWTKIVTGVAARDFARATRGISEPEAILPVTAHAAFQKGCHYLGVKKVLVPVDTKTFKSDPAIIEKAITPNTVLIVSSAVSYAHGVLDPIRPE